MNFDLEQTCNICEGQGKVLYSDIMCELRIRDCPGCGGSKKMPSDLGCALLAFIEKYKDEIRPLHYLPDDIRQGIIERTKPLPATAVGPRE